MTMRYKVTCFLIICSLTLQFASGQNATIWGPGEEYEIDYLHSGQYSLDDQSEISFTNEPSAEYTIYNLTNSGYDYIYLGYNSLSDTGTIVMEEFSFGATSFSFPSGGMPIVLPLSYGDEDEWLISFSEQLDELSAIGESNSNGLFNANSSTDNEYMYIEFEINSNSSVELENGQVFFDLPQLQLPEYEGKNNSYVNSTLSGDLSYKLSTGVLFFLNITLVADALLVDSIDQGSLINSQRFEFVAIIPPASIIDELRFDVIFLATLVLILIPLRRALRGIFS